MLFLLNAYALTGAFFKMKFKISFAVFFNTLFIASLKLIFVF